VYSYLSYTVNIGGGTIVNTILPPLYFFSPYERYIDTLPFMEGSGYVPIELDLDL